MKFKIKPKKRYSMYVDPADSVSGVDKISLVNSPAIEINWHAYSKQENFGFKVSADEKQMISGPFMIPNKPIYRINPETQEEYYVEFTTEMIETIVKKFFKNGKVMNINEEHTEKMVGAYVVESWIIQDPDTDKSKLFGFQELPVGTWFGTVFIEDSEYWNEYIKSNKVLGFSIEGMMGLQEMQSNKFALNELPPVHPNCKCKIENGKWNITEEGIYPCIDCIKAKKRYESKNRMNKMKQKFAQYEMADGTFIEIEGDSIVEGVSVRVVDAESNPVMDAEGNEVVLSDGEYELVDGTKITLVEGKVSMIVMPEEVKEEVAMQLTPEEKAMLMAEVTAVMDAYKAEMETMIVDLKSRLDEMEAKKAEAEAEVTAMKTQIASFSKIAGATSKTTISDKVIKTKVSDLEKVHEVAMYLQKSK